MRIRRLSFPFLNLLLTCAVVAVLTACVSVSNAQTWTQIGSLPNASDLRCAYFWDPAHGVVGGVGCIYTYNSGTWTQATYPEPPGIIKSLRLLDPTHLYAASGSTDVWVSADRGATWALTGTGLSNADDIYLGPDGQIHGMNIKGTGMMQGTSFARANAMSCAAARDDLGYMAYSTNGGLLWGPSLTPMDCGYCCVVDTCTGIYYTLTDGSKAVLYQSDNGGESWSSIYDFTNTANDILEGANSGVLYVQTSRDVQRYRPKDGWQNIGGPASSLEDRRMFSFGQYNRYLVDMDSGAVWLWDGPNESSEGAFDNPIVSANITPVGCDLTHIFLNLVWTKPEDSLHIHAYTKDGTIISPEDITLYSSANVSTVFYTVQIPKGQESGTFYFHDSVWPGPECLPQEAWDISYNFKLVPESPRVTLPASVSLLPCQDVMFPLTIEADSCDTVRIDSVQIMSSSGSYLLDHQPPDVILPGQSDTFWITASNFQTGKYTVSVRVKGGSYSSSFGFDTTLTTIVNVRSSGPPSTITLKNVPKVLDCKTARIPLSIATSLCDTLWIDSLKFEDTSGAYSLDHNPPDIVLPGNRDTFWILVSQTIPGPYFAIIHVYGRSLSGSMAIDTLILMSYSVIPDPSTPRAIAHNISVSNCKASVVPIVLQALACDSVEFSSCALTIDKSLSYSTNLSFPRMLAVSEADSLLIVFPPQNLNGAYIIYAEVKGTYTGSTLIFDTTFQIRVTFTSSGGALIANTDAIGLDTVSTCSSSDTSVTFVNLGCDTISVTGDRTSWKAGWNADDPSFPFTLAQDSGFTVRIHFHPAGPATSYQSLIFGFEDDGGTSGTSSGLTMSAVATPAPASLSISNSALDLGAFSLCSASADTTVTLTNMGCDSLAISGASVDAGNGFTLVSGADTILGPNESAQYEIHFSDSVTGAMSSALHIHGVGEHGGNAIDTLVSLSAVIVSGPSMASITPAAIDFGTTSVCEERDSSVTITNRGCDTLSIMSGIFSSLQFGFSDTTHFPIVLQPNSSATFPIFTHLDTTGHPATITSVLNFTSDSGVAIPAVTLSRSVTYPGKFSLALEAQDSSAVSASVPIFVMRKGTVPSQADEVDFDLVYNDDILSYNKAVQPDIKLVGESKLPNGLTDRSFAMKPASDRDTIATLQFTSYLSKSDRTTIGLTHQQFLASGSVSLASCIATMDTASIPSDFQIELVCGDSAILATLNGEPPFSIVSIQPNPAQNEILVGYRVYGLAYSDLEIELQDILGQTVLTQRTASMSAGTQHLDVSSLLSGVYYIRVSSNGYVQTRCVSIER